MTIRRRKFWGWGYEGEGLSPDEMQLLARVLAGASATGRLRPQPVRRPASAAR